jgi:hypothetical protein
VFGKGELVVRRGRKARGLPQTAQLPGVIHSLPARSRTRRFTISLLNHAGASRRLGRLAALTAALLFAIPAIASAATCPTPQTTGPFTLWGDTGSYFSLPGGNFESPLDASGWVVNRAERAPGNEPFLVGAPTDSSSLVIGGGGIALSPPFCIDNSMPYLRFFARSLGANGKLEVRLVVQTRAGLVTAPFTRVADLTAGSMPSWAPTGQLALADGVTGSAGRTTTARLAFSVAGHGGWQVDDIYVDPYRMG